MTDSLEKGLGRRDIVQGAVWGSLRAGMAGLVLCCCGGGALADPPASAPTGNFFSSLKQAFNEDLEHAVVHGHFDVGSPPDAHRYYCLVDSKTGKGQANGVAGEPVSRPDGMTGIKAGAVSFYSCADAERQGILVTAGYRLSASAAAGVATGAAAAAGANRMAIPDSPPPQGRQQLVGAWRLVAMEYKGPSGETVDPFYQAGSSGIIIYDPSGWMSVQIAAPNRRAWEVPAARVPGATSEDVKRKAEAFDTYYSYFGTWDYDAVTSVVTHHLKASVIPAESGLNYAQSVALEGGRLTFTVRSGDPGAQTVRKKIWERLSSSP